MNKTIIGIVIFWILFIAGMIYTSGLPNSKTYLFEESGVMCRKWNETWSMDFDHSECWQLEKITK